jgi:hypothetical protein
LTCTNTPRNAGRYRFSVKENAMSTSPGVRLAQQRDFQFKVDFGGAIAPLQVDEPQQPEPISGEVHTQTARNAEGRLRIKTIDVVLKLGQPAAALQHLDRALAQFEDFCTVTQSVRGGIEVSVQVHDAAGTRLK